MSLHSENTTKRWTHILSSTEQISIKLNIMQINASLLYIKNRLEIIVLRSTQHVAVCISGMKFYINVFAECCKLLWHWCFIDVSFPKPSIQRKAYVSKKREYKEIASKLISGKTNRWSIINTYQKWSNRTLLKNLFWNFYLVSLLSPSW